MYGKKVFLNNAMKILIVTSPTGGHFFPAIEVAKKLLNRSEKIIFITQQRDKLTDIIKEELRDKDKINLFFIRSEKFYRKNPFLLIKLLLYLIFAILETVIIIMKEKPKIVFSTGGYTSVPVIIAVKLTNPFVPIILHEQNCVLSLTNKFLSIFASKVCLGFDIKKGKKFTYTGNPLREKIFSFVDKDKFFYQNKFTKEKLTLFIFGGSQGAHSINEAILKFLKEYESRIANLIQVIHITGFNDFEYVKEFYKNLNLSNIVMSFSTDIHILYSVADIVICRAGAMTITELIYFKKPAILIPLLTAAELHQNHNANFLKKYGCAEVVYQRANWESKFQKILLNMIENPSIIEHMKQSYSFIYTPHTTIESIIQNIYKQRYAKRT